MSQDRQRQAAEALATIGAHQERARRAARLPWWVYAAMFVLAAGGSAANDFVSLSGTKLIAVLVVVALVVTLVVTDVAGAVGLDHYPNTVAGVLYGAAFTALFALTQLLITVSQRRTSR